jgi:maltose alpha-D-glucosyltransferase/alpha-amylase
MIDRSDPNWYRDAIIYQLHIKSFFDANNDGIGDVNGVIEKLDYIKDLGATAIWLMPFYPSPLRDDGYDISDYRDINPAYGNMRDLRRLIREAHARDLRVITELINHTSDKHPWFQRARAAKPGSAQRNFYVWSDTDQIYKDARIIFLDTETSNWTWDPVAQAYYWHRFYSHQPDLNYDNPKVLEAVLDVMRYWLDMGVDGLRLDAIPYLVERDGTSCENLPETHAIIKKIRAALDERYPDRMLLAEANQWPEDSAAYFGDGDECHMAFHFPLMPRMYMSLALEDRHPVTDIMRQTPEIPANAQWAIFLRNHDELTLEMVTDRERDYLWTFYAADRRARINLGIRRRLAPLLENDRRKIELMNSLLFSMPGTPVIYYGDEIGMGDNIYVGDRDGVRTPMQWSPDRNGGFSRGDPARLFLPAIQDAIYGFNSVNVEAQLGIPHSLLHWMRRMIAIRLRHKALGRGSLRFLYPANRKVLAYLRELGEDQLLCIANVSRAPQAVELDLGEFAGCTLIELTAGTAFPQIGGLPYLLTLPGYSFFWFRIDRTQARQDRFGPPPAAELFTLVLRGAVSTLLQGRERTAFETRVAPQFLGARRWYAGKSSGTPQVTLQDQASLVTADRTYLLPLLAVSAKGQRRGRYFTPLAVDETQEDEAVSAYAVARVRRGAKVGFVFDADADPGFAPTVGQAMLAGHELTTEGGGSIRFFATKALEQEDLQPGRRIGGEQSNSSIALGDRAVLKVYRRVMPGLNPEIEIGRFLTEVANFNNAAALLGWSEHVQPDGETRSLCILQQFVPNQGDAWTWALDALKIAFDRLDAAPADQDPEAPSAFSNITPYIEVLGKRTGELHRALATETADEAFKSAPLDASAVRETLTDARRNLNRLFTLLPSWQGNAPPADAAAALDLMDRRGELEALLDALSTPPADMHRIRIHGDLHLGQILMAQQDVVFVDFEGEPARSIDERRRKDSPWRDVAGLIRSFDYAVEAAARNMPERPAASVPRTERDATRWLKVAQEIFIEAYLQHAPAEIVGGDEGRRRLLPLYLISKALYEVNYELDNRPAWVGIPLRSLIAILDEAGAAP